MLHTISQLCDKVDVLKVKSDTLRGKVKARKDGCSIPREELNNQVADIQYICNLIANDIQLHIQKKLLEKNSLS